MRLFMLNLKKKNNSPKRFNRGSIPRIGTTLKTHTQMEEEEYKEIKGALGCAAVICSVAAVVIYIAYLIISKIILIINSL